jgi:hypothetical protein
MKINICGAKSFKLCKIEHSTMQTPNCIRGAAMPNKKSTFESHDLSSSLTLEVEADEETPKDEKYLGQERRRANRREATERREEVRFEIKKTDRREKQGRRSDDKSPTFY